MSTVLSYIHNKPIALGNVSSALEQMRNYHKPGHYADFGTTMGMLIANFDDCYFEEMKIMDERYSLSLTKHTFLTNSQLLTATYSSNISLFEVFDACGLSETKFQFVFAEQTQAWDKTESPAIGFTDTTGLAVCANLSWVLEESPKTSKRIPEIAERLGIKKCTQDFNRDDRVLFTINWIENILAESDVNATMILHEIPTLIHSLLLRKEGNNLKLYGLRRGSREDGLVYHRPYLYYAEDGDNGIMIANTIAALREIENGVFQINEARSVREMEPMERVIVIDKVVKEGQASIRIGLSKER